MKLVLPTVMIIAAAGLAACERPASTSSTTVVKEPTTVVQAEPQQPSSSTTIINPPTPAPNVAIDASKPDTERTRSTTTERVDTPMGTATRETETKSVTR